MNLWLAPLDGITNYLFRNSLCRHFGGIDCFMTPFMPVQERAKLNVTNWRDIWYWGAREAALKKSGRTHDELLEYAGGKPFMLIAGMYDGAEACAAIRRVKAYEGHQERLELINHASGHRPPPDALEAGYRFLERHLGVKPSSAQSGIINGQ